MAAAFIVRVLGFVNRIYMSNILGAEGMGLYTLVMSVYSLAVTVSIFGMSLACTRLVAEESASLNHKGVKYAVKKCVIYGALSGTVAAIVIFLCADFIGSKILGNKLTVISLQAFGVCLPFLSVSSILNGYFTAVSRITKSSLVQFAELFTRMATIILFLNFVFPKTLEFSCFSVVLGGTIAETLSCIYYAIIYFKDVKIYKNKGDTKGIKKRIFKIAVPIALSSCLKSGLSTIKHILIPIQLKKSGMSAGTALSQYGIIQGMVMPVIMYPSAIILSFSSLILPEFSQLYIKNNNQSEMPSPYAYYKKLRPEYFSDTIVKYEVPLTQELFNLQLKLLSIHLTILQIDKLQLLH